MEWTAQQDKALVQVSKWLKEGKEQVFRLFGYAGTGKTTLAHHLAEDVRGRVLFGAYTGKAVHVLQQKGCKEAQTIHSMLYHVQERNKENLRKHENKLVEIITDINAKYHETKTGDEIKAMIDGNSEVTKIRNSIEDEKKQLAQPAFTLNEYSPVKESALVVIDECSMVDDRMGQDLLSFGTKVLVLGDPAQLPPVKGSGFFTDTDSPDIMLTEIHRQAEDNPIIAMATKARNKEPLPLGKYGNSRILEKHKLNGEVALRADQILVGKNITRRGCNKRMRALLDRGESMLPVEGDKLVCLRNNYNIGLLNGAIWNVMDVGQYADETVVMTVNNPQNPEPLEVEAHTHYFWGEERVMSYWKRKEAEEFDYGYALTVHKAQGSQWDNVLLFDESGSFRKDAWRWLYTGITRAAKNLIIARESM